MREQIKRNFLSMLEKAIPDKLRPYQRRQLVYVEEIGTGANAGKARVSGTKRDSQRFEAK